MECQQAPRLLSFKIQNQQKKNLGVNDKPTLCLGKPYRYLFQQNILKY